MFCKSELPVQLDHELPVRLALADRHYFLGDDIHERRLRPLDVQVQARFVALQVRRGRQHDIRQLRCRGHEQVVNHKQSAFAR